MMITLMTEANSIFIDIVAVRATYTIGQFIVLIEFSVAPPDGPGRTCAVLPAAREDVA